MAKHDTREIIKFYNQRLGVPAALMRYRVMIGFPVHSIGATTQVAGEYGYEPFDMPGQAPLKNQ